jgi:hypothetical protein
MKSRGILCASLFAASLMAVPMFAVPVSQQARPQRETATASQMTSGKVAAVAADSFSLEIKQGETSQTLQFTTDANTKIQGKLAVGAVASVEYRTDNDGRNIATAVVVQSNG